MAHRRSASTELRRALGPLDLANPGLWTLAERPAPIDIACELCRAMEVGRIPKRGKVYAQTVYTVQLSPGDLARYAGRKRELVATLKDTLLWWAREHAYVLPGDARVRLEEDAQLRDGQVSIEAGFRPEEALKLGRARRAD